LPPLVPQPAGDTTIHLFESRHLLVALRNRDNELARQSITCFCLLVYSISYRARHIPCLIFFSKLI
jgi:hypothetical protein